MDMKYSEHKKRVHSALKIPSLKQWQKTLSLLQRSFAVPFPGT